MASTKRQIPFSQYLQVRAVLVSHPPTKPCLSLCHSWQMRGGEIALSCLWIPHLPAGSVHRPGGDARKQKYFHLSWAMPFAPGPQRAMAGSSSNCFIFAGPPTSATSTGREVLGSRAPQQGQFGCPGMAKPHTGLCELALHCTELGTTFSSAIKAEPEGKRVVLEDVWSWQKGKLVFILKSLQKIQEATRRGEKNLYPFALWRNPWIQKWEGIIRILLI